MIAARSLEAVDSSGLTLADVVGGAGAGTSSPAPLGRGAFGNVGAFRYHGASVAVKELQAGADEESIGPAVFSLACFFYVAWLWLGGGVSVPLHIACLWCLSLAKGRRVPWRRASFCFCRFLGWSMVGLCGLCGLCW